MSELTGRPGTRDVQSVPTRMSELEKVKTEFVAKCQALINRIVESEDSNEKLALHTELKLLLMEKKR